eukprot:10644644-Alexandrium_andersonii.AAC.1
MQRLSADVQLGRAASITSAAGAQRAQIVYRGALVINSGGCEGATTKGQWRFSAVFGCPGQL